MLFISYEGNIVKIRVRRRTLKETSSFNPLSIFTRSNLKISNSSYNHIWLLCFLFCEHCMIFTIIWVVNLEINTDLDWAMNSLSHSFEHKWIISCCYCSALQVMEGGAKKWQINYNVWWCTQSKKIILQYSRISIFICVALILL